jgi:hypothetical protein
VPFKRNLNIVTLLLRDSNNQMDLKDFFISVETFPEGFSGLFQLLTLAFGYGYILMYASNLISDGSELLLLVPSIAGLVGSVVLPILGAVPDGCIGKSVFSDLYIVYSIYISKWTTLSL